MISIARLGQLWLSGVSRHFLALLVNTHLQVQADRLRRGNAWDLVIDLVV